MFKVQNADFIADKLAAELPDNQEFREVLKNALEAIERRRGAESEPTPGRVEFDVDWTMHRQTGRWYVSCADNGDGMTRSELDRYTTTLAVQGAGKNQSLTGNQGMGLKISGPTRHKTGVLIRSLKNAERTAVQIGWDGTEYGLIPIGRNDELVTSMPTGAFPDFVNEKGSGTVVTFLGNTEDDNTFVPPRKARGWLFKYLNTRFFRLSNDHVTVLVRVPSGDQEDWAHSLDEASERMKGRGRSFNLQAVYGTATVWDKAADLQEKPSRGIVPLPGRPADGIPPANLWWWVLPTGEGSDVSSRTHGGGSFAVLYQNELHDWRTSTQANTFFARFGVLFGKSRMTFVLEPQGPSVSSDFARARVLVGGAPALDGEGLLLWAEQFRALMPERVRETMAEEQERLQIEDPDRVRRIRERLKEVMQLLRPRRFRISDGSGPKRAGGPEVIGPGALEGTVVDLGDSPKPRSTKRQKARGIGAVLSELEDEGVPVSEISISQTLEPRWVTEEQSEGIPIVKGNANGMRDRAAALGGADGRTAGILLLNREFRGYQAILAAMNEWANPEGDETKLRKIEEITQEWIEQKMVEAVQGLRQLENGKTWITEHYDDALSPVALTAAFMADRYHTLREIRRQVGSFREPSITKKTKPLVDG